MVKALDSAAAGGLVGSLDGGSMTLTRCYRYGDVLGGLCAGGFVGQIAEQADCTASYGYAALAACRRGRGSTGKLGRAADCQRGESRRTVR